MKRALLLMAVLLVFSSTALSLSEVERYRLPNGLTVLMAREPRLPLVNVTCLYKVGGANERAGLTGIAHYVEHMAFRETENVSQADLTGAVERIGGRWNGYAWIDQTLYAATIPNWALDSYLGIEAERMSRVLFDSDDFERERTSVISELQGYENDPASILYDLTVASSFELHPYRFNVIGWLTDVLSIQASEAQEFYRDFYGPDNAVLVLVGDIDFEETRGKIDSHFGSLQPSRRSSALRVVEPPQRGQKRVELRYPGSERNLLLVFRAPSATDPEFAAFLVFDVILAGGRGLGFGSRQAEPTSLLQQAAERAGARQASTSLTPSRDPYVYAISVSAAPTTDLETLESSIRETIDRLGTEGPSESDLSKARSRVRAEIAYDTDTLAQLAHRLAYFESIECWELQEKITTAMDRLAPADIRAFVQKHLRPEKTTVGAHVPAETEGVQKVEIPKVELPDPVVPPPSPVPEKALLPLKDIPIQTARNELSNGVVVRVASRAGNTACLTMRLGFGSRLDAPGRDGLALLAARSVTGNSELMARLAEVGARPSDTAQDAPTAYSNLEYVDWTVRFLPEDLDMVAGELASVLADRPVSTQRIETVRAKLQEEIAGLEGDAGWIATKNALALSDPGWRSPVGTEASLARVTSEDVEAFLESHLVGAAVTIGLAHPAKPAETMDTLSRVFSRIPAGKLESAEKAAPAAEPSEVENEAVAMEGKTQAEIVAALPGVARAHSDYVALSLLNYVLGETGYAGRLGERLVDTGLTYSVYSSPQGGRVSGPILIQTSAAPANLERTLSRIRSVLRELSTTGIEDTEWRESRAYRLGRLVVGVEAADRLAGALVEAEYFGRDRLDLEARSKEILSITREELNDVARRYLRPELLEVGIAGAIPSDFSSR